MALTGNSKRFFTFFFFFYRRYRTELETFFQSFFCFFDQSYMCFRPKEWEQLNYDIHTLRYTRREVRARWKKILLQMGETLFLILKQDNKHQVDNIYIYIFILGGGTRCKKFQTTGLCCYFGGEGGVSSCRLSVWGGCFVGRQQAKLLQSRPGGSRQSYWTLDPIVGTHFPVSWWNRTPDQIPLCHGTRARTQTHPHVPNSHRHN